MASKPDGRCTEVIGLGRFRKLYRTANIFQAVAVVLAAMMLTPLAFRLISRQPFAEGGLADLLLSMVGAPLVIWAMWSRQSDAVALYDGGIACWRRQGLIQIRWQDIGRIWKTPYDSDKMLSVAPYCIGTRAGGIVELTGLAGLDELWAVIEQHVAKAGLPAVLEQIRLGETVPFGPFEVSASGLAFTKKGQERFAEWARIESVKPQAWPKNIVVLAEGEHSDSIKEWARVPQVEIRDLHIFLALCKRLLGDDRTE